MDWWVQRLATSDRYRCSPYEVRELWSYADTVEAHLTLDALDEIAALHRPPPPKPR